MTPVNLGALPSNNPVPAGRPVDHHVDSAGGVAFPPQANWIVLDTDGSVGPFNLPYRYWLHVGSNNIYYCSTAWTRRDVAHRLVVNGAYGSDLNGRSLHQNADSSETVHWDGNSLESQWYCEANVAYHVYWVSWNSPGGVQYYRHPTHTNMWAYTVGEGVY
jgi:hypothetical protein